MKGWLCDELVEDREKVTANILRRYCDVCCKYWEKSPYFY